MKERNNHKHTVTACIERFRITDSFYVNKNETKEIPFTFQLPHDTPLSLGKSKVWVTTGLAIKNAVDPSDKDYINIAPTPLVSAVFQSIEQLGFWLRDVECEEAPHRLRRRFPFVQEIEFVPHGGPFRGQLDELEMIIYPSSHVDQIELLLQIDRRAHGLGGLLAEALDIDETNVRLTVSNQDIPYLTKKIQNVIQKYA
jgi:sporulation-control protein